MLKPFTLLIYLFFSLKPKVGVLKMQRIFQCFSQRKVSSELSSRQVRENSSSLEETKTHSFFSSFSFRKNPCLKKEKKVARHKIVPSSMERQSFNSIRNLLKENFSSETQHMLNSFTPKTQHKYSSDLSKTSLSAQKSLSISSKGPKIKHLSKRIIASKKGVNRDDLIEFQESKSDLSLKLARFRITQKLAFSREFKNIYLSHLDPLEKSDKISKLSFPTCNYELLYQDADGKWYHTDKQTSFNPLADGKFVYVITAYNAIHIRPLLQGGILPLAAINCRLNSLEKSN